MNSEASRMLMRKHLVDAIGAVEAPNGEARDLLGLLVDYVQRAQDTELESFRQMTTLDQNRAADVSFSAKGVEYLSGLTVADADDAGKVFAELGRIEQAEMWLRVGDTKTDDA